jgi:UDP-glucuronate decarboxylase
VLEPLPVDDPRRRRSDIGKAEQLLAWIPHTTLGQGLRATIAWFEDGARRSGASGREGAAVNA